MNLRRLAFCASLFALVSCGENGETVFLYFINGYPGAETASVIGTSGPLVNNANFADRHGRSGVCRPGNNRCFPIEYNRQIDGRFDVIVNGMPDTAKVTLGLEDMYPQETGTVLFGRRSSESSVDMQLLRHTQSISSTCMLTFVNALALDNNNDLTVDEQFGYIPEFNLTDRPLPEIGYLDETNTPIPTECGLLPLDGRHDEFARSELPGLIAESPWFVTTECSEEDDFESSICFNWSPVVVDGRGIISIDGEALSMRNTQEYYNCLQDAFTFNVQDEMSMAPPPGAEDSCPPLPLTWDKVAVDEIRADECRRARFEEPLNVTPNDERLSYIFYDGICDFQVRLRTPGQDVIFEGKHQNGDLVESDITVDPGSEHFWVLFGRPVNPLLWRWDSGNQIADLEDFPYFNSANRRIGDY